MWSMLGNKFRFAGALGAVGAFGAFCVQTKSVKADDSLPAPHYKWPHTGNLSGYDHRSLRRGYQVYKEVCASCHSLNLIAWRNLVNVLATEEEAKEWAAEIDYPDGPNDVGDMFERPGKLADYMPKPYPNDNAGRAANNGALPPDLSLIKKARVGGEDYLFALLTGYHAPPVGVTLREGMSYNPYFPGGAIAMPQPLHADQVDYEDGTEASISQMAKDVSSFLSWAAEPELEERKQMGVKAILLLSLALIPTLYYKRLKWSVLKTRQLRFTKL